ncbi:MAG: STAS domain-containing protein [Proteobacteria bacterium]|nr:STAS domain-containing protein [Desulfobacula sp.]MBU4131805.1 STAS domain-containing protein [Pseudomonadota bacterium]
MDTPDITADISLFSRLIRLLKPDSLLPAMTAGTSNAILIISVELSFAAMLFSQDLSFFMSKGIGILLFGTFIIGMLTTIFSSHPSAAALVQDAPVAILGMPLVTISATMTTGAASQESIFYTAILTIAISTLVTGLLMVGMARFKLGNFVRFIPYPVIGGFLAGIGWLLFKGGIGVMTRLPMDISSLSSLLVPIALLKWVPGVLFALVLYYLLRTYSHFMILPGMVIGAIVLFFATLKLSGTSFSQAQLGGWFLGPFPKGALWEPVPFSGLSQVRWDLVFGQSLTMVSIFIISIISLLLNASGLELVSRKDIDLNNELTVAGGANILASFVGSAPGYMGLATSALFHKLTPGSRLSGFISSVLIGGILIAGTSALAGFPRALAGAMLVLVGVDMLWEWLHDSWFKLPKTDYFLILVILVVIASLGFLEGVAAGLVIAVVLFVVNYSRINIVKSSSSGKNLQSNVERSAPHRWLLNKKGDQILILQLQGFIFFGTANQLRTRIIEKATDQKQSALNYIVLDFHKVNGFDSSAVNSFERIQQFVQAQDICLVFVNITPPLRAQFNKTNLTPNTVWFFSDLDHGLEWCEDQLLNMEKKAGAPKKDQVFESTFADMWVALAQMETFEQLLTGMAGYLTPGLIQADRFLFQKGEPIQGLYFIESGRISIFLDQEGENPPIRLRTMGAGSIIGEQGDCEQNNSITSVMGVTSGQVYHLSSKSLESMEKNDPELAFKLYKHMTQILSERLCKTNNIIRDLI